MCTVLYCTSSTYFHLPWELGEEGFNPLANFTTYIVKGSYHTDKGPYKLRKEWNVNKMVKELTNR